MARVSKVGGIRRWRPRPADITTAIRASVKFQCFGVVESEFAMSVRAKKHHHPALKHGAYSVTRLLPGEV
jgi:hypothetical protein